MREWEYLIHIYTRGVTGKTPEAPTEEVDFSRVLKLANRHAISGVVAHALKNAEFCPAEIRSECMRIALGEAMGNINRKEALFGVLAILESNGFHPVIIKGYDIARFYAHAELRSSADSDIFFCEEEFLPALEYLRNLGFSVDEFRGTNNHVAAKREDVGLIEVHHRLFSEHFAVGLLNGYDIISLSDTVRVKFENYEFCAFAPDTVLRFIAIHTAKHFIIEGISIRRALDFAIYYQNCFKTVDIEKFWADMATLKFDAFLKTLLSFFVVYGCFCAEDFGLCEIEDAKKTEALFWDIKNYTSLEESGNGLSWEYFYHHRKGNRFKTFSKRVKHWLQPLRVLLFSSYDSMKKRYPYLVKMPFLYPVAPVQRAVEGLRSKTKRGYIKNTGIVEVSDRTQR